jgi:hypothetical protein
MASSSRPALAEHCIIILKATIEATRPSLLLWKRAGTAAEKRPNVFEKVFWLPLWNDDVRLSLLIRGSG